MSDLDPWARLRAPFPASQIEWLPRPLRSGDTDRGWCRPGSPYTADQRACGGLHARSIHLAYVGHAGVTQRLLDVDPTWTWQPVALDDDGLPRLTRDQLLWIRLTVLGVTRLGVGDARVASTRPPGDMMKERIGDALRNAALRFGVGTYLWSKSEESQLLRAGGELPEPAPPPPARQTIRRTTPARPPVRSLRADTRRDDDEPPLVPLTGDDDE